MGEDTLMGRLPHTGSPLAFVEHAMFRKEGGRHGLEMEVDMMANI